MQKSQDLALPYCASDTYDITPIYQESDISYRIALMPPFQPQPAGIELTPPFIKKCVAFSWPEWRKRIQPTNDFVNQNIQTLTPFATAKQGEYVLENRNDSRASICFDPCWWMTVSIDGSTPIEVKDIEELERELRTCRFIY